jgi:hypothetical protein
LDRLAEEVNDKLQESGQVTISELCKTYDLPGNFLTQVFFLNSIVCLFNKELFNCIIVLLMYHLPKVKMHFRCKKKNMKLGLMLV